VRCALCIIGEGRCWEKEREKEKEKEKEDRLGREEETWCLDIRGGGGVCDDVRAVIWDWGWGWGWDGIGMGLWGLGWDLGGGSVCGAVLCCFGEVWRFAEVGDRCKGYGI